MAKGFDTVAVYLGADVANGGTFTVSYPSGKNLGDYAFAFGHFLSLNGDTLRQPQDITLSFSTSSVTVTNDTGSTLPAGSKGYFQFEKAGDDKRIVGYTGATRVDVKRTQGAEIVRINLGAPITADDDGVCASQGGSSGVAMTINGALTTSGVATFDVPRAVVAAWTNTAILTIVGTDEYGNAVIETSASGTSHAGKKAFKTVTSVTPNATITGATVGTGDVLGLPVFLSSSALILKELQDDAAATAGTTVAGLTRNTESTSTTADVRGTYDPNAACNGAKAFSIVVVLQDPEFQGNAQYAG
ncbi:MAG: hypothetical protein KBC53_03505 [Nitrosomonas sp.]|nr:hypothetical protein [Nitrosomonas sp.]